MTIWYWIEGLTEKGTWMPLYGHRDNRPLAKAVLRLCLQAEPDPATMDKFQLREAQLLQEFEDFRLTEDHGPASQRLAVKTRKKAKSERGSVRVSCCPQCGGDDLKRVKINGIKHWRCKSCRWKAPRSPGEALQMPSEARKGKRKGRTAQK